MEMGKKVFCFKKNNVLIEAKVTNVLCYTDNEGKDAILLLVGSQNGAHLEWYDSRVVFETKEAAKVEQLILLEDNYEHLKNAIMGAKAKKI